MSVEAFLAAKWKSAQASTEEVETTPTTEEVETTPSTEEVETTPPTPTPTWTHRPKITEDFPPMQEIPKKITIVPNNQGTNITRMMIVKQIVEGATSDDVLNQDFTNFEPKIELEAIKCLDEREIIDKEISEFKEEAIDIKENIPPLQNHSSNYNGQEESDRMTTATTNGETLNQHATSSDVWKLLEEQNEDNESEFQAQTADVQDEQERNVGAGQTVTGVPTMAIPFGKFGKLLQQQGSMDCKIRQRDTTKENISTPTLKGLLNSDVTYTPQGRTKRTRTAQGKDTRCPKDASDQAVQRTRLSDQSNQAPVQRTRHNDQCNQAPVQRTRLNNPSHQAPFQAPDSTTKVKKRQVPKSPTMQTNIQSTFMLDGPCLTLDPELGPIDPRVNASKTSATKTGTIPISRFKAKYDSVTKSITYNVFKYFENRKRQYNLRASELRLASDATGMARNKILAIMAEADESIQQYDKVIFPEERSRRLPKRTFSEPNVKRDCVARMFIHNSYLIYKEVPTLKNIIANCQENGFGHVLGTSEHCVKAYLKKLGFEYNAASGTKVFLMERPDFIGQRFRYLEKMQQYRAQNKNIIFVFVADLLKKGVTSVEWESWDGQSYEGQERVDLGSMTVLHAACRNFVFHDCIYIMENQVTMVKKNCHKWLINLLKKAPRGSVIVLGDRRFHVSVDVEKRPDAGRSKVQISEWLKGHDVDFDEAWPKAVLLERVNKVVVGKKFLVDDDVTTLGHIPVHLPLHHRDLNPLSFMWQDIKDKMDKTPDINNLRKARQFVVDEFAKAATKLGKAWSQVEKLEKSYYNIDKHTDNVLEELILKYGSGLVPIEDETSDEEGDCDSEEPPSKTPRTAPS